MPRASPDLAAALDRLERFHGRLPAAPPRTPLAWVLWENVAYLVNDARRAEVFAALAARTGLDPARIARLSDDALEAIVGPGGMRPADRARKVRECAAIALALGGGDLRQLLDLPPPKARAALKRFPGIGAPGADWILLASGGEARPALESNALRVVQRLGLAPLGGAYAVQHRAAVAAVAAALPAAREGLVRARNLLRAHGQRTCRNTAPECDACPLEAECPRAGL